MKNDFQPVVRPSLQLSRHSHAHWNGVVDCEVLVVEPYERLSYSWNASGAEAAEGLKTVVTWILTPTRSGTYVRMEQSSFRPEDEGNFKGASDGWAR